MDGVPVDYEGLRVTKPPFSSWFTDACGVRRLGIWRVAVHAEREVSCGQLILNSAGSETGNCWDLRCLYQVASCELLCFWVLVRVCLSTILLWPYLFLFVLHLPVWCFCKPLIVWHQLPLLLRCCEISWTHEWITAVVCLLRRLVFLLGFLSQRNKILETLQKHPLFRTHTCFARAELKNWWMLKDPYINLNITMEKNTVFLVFSCVFTHSSARSCEAPSWNSWLTLFPSPSSSACWSSMHPTALRGLRICQMRPSQTTHDRCSGSKPLSSPGQRCWSWNGCWVSLLCITHIIVKYFNSAAVEQDDWFIVIRGQNLISLVRR